MSSSPLSLEDRTAIVTGGARGLGRAYALRLAEHGANVAVADIDLTAYNEYEHEQNLMEGKTVIEEVREKNGRAFGVEIDVTDFESVKAFVSSVSEEFGSIDILVANAGGGDGRMGDTFASDLSPDHLRSTVERNLYGTVFSCVSVAPHMRSQEQGKIITVASQAGRAVLGDGTYAHYGAAKAAVIMYTKYLAQDLGRFGITANAIAPGYIETGKLRASLTEEDLEEIDSRVVLGRLGIPKDCVKVVEFLASPLSDYVTGAVIPVDGGSLAI